MSRVLGYGVRLRLPASACGPLAATSQGRGRRITSAMARARHCLRIAHTRAMRSAVHPEMGTKRKRLARPRRSCPSGVAPSTGITTVRPSAAPATRARARGGQKSGQMSGTSSLPLWVMSLKRRSSARGSESPPLQTSPCDIFHQPLASRVQVIGPLGVCATALLIEEIHPSAVDTSAPLGDSHGRLGISRRRISMAGVGR